MLCIQVVYAYYTRFLITISLSLSPLPLPPSMVCLIASSSPFFHLSTAVAFHASLAIITGCGTSLQLFSQMKALGTVDERNANAPVWQIPEAITRQQYYIVWLMAGVPVQWKFQHFFNYLLRLIACHYSLQTLFPFLPAHNCFVNCSTITTIFSIYTIIVFVCSWCSTMVILVLPLLVWDRIGLLLILLLNPSLTICCFPYHPVRQSMAFQE